MIGQAAHVCSDGVAHDVRGLPEDLALRNLVYDRWVELSDRAIVQFIEDGKTKGYDCPPITFLHWPGLDQEG
eukprot:557169-Alexandrium_andersonii.AAC.1